MANIKLKKYIKLIIEQEINENNNYKKIFKNNWEYVYKFVLLYKFSIQNFKADENKIINEFISEILENISMPNSPFINLFYLTSEELEKSFKQLFPELCYNYSTRSEYIINNIHLCDNPDIKYKNINVKNLIDYLLKHNKIQKCLKTNNFYTAIGNAFKEAYNYLIKYYPEITEEILKFVKTGIYNQQIYSNIYHKIIKYNIRNTFLNDLIINNVVPQIYSYKYLIEQNKNDIVNCINRTILSMDKYIIKSALQLEYK